MKTLWLLLPAFFLVGGLSFARDTSSGTTPKILKPCPVSPNCVSSKDAGDAEHAILPLTYQSSRAEARARLRQVLTEMKRMTIVADEDDYIHAEARSLIFRFVDDVEFIFPDSEKVIHLRSASRVGYSDLGVNRKRVEEIRRRFTKP